MAGKRRVNPDVQIGREQREIASCAGRENDRTMSDMSFYWMYRDFYRKRTDKWQDSTLGIS